MSRLEVSGLTIGTADTPHPLVRDFECTLEPGEIVGLVGESGSGKTMVSLAMMGLLPPGISVRSGTAQLDGRTFMDASTSRSARRAGEMSMIFQNPRRSLNPTMRVGQQLARVLRFNQRASRSQAESESVDLLKKVGIPGASRAARAYPHQLSGGMCQRALIAMALACRPRVLIADEPTTGLDVTVQAQVFDLLRDLVEETGCSILFITHDLASVAEMCDRVVVLYGGQVMEQGSTLGVYEGPLHPYTQMLLGSATGRDQRAAADDAPVDLSLPGCRFAHRCPHVFDACADPPPLFESTGGGQRYSCFLREETRVGAARDS